MIIRGYDAISVAEKLNIPLSKYADPDEHDFRTDLSVEEAKRIAGKDENFIFVDLDIYKLTREQLVELASALGRLPDETFGSARERFDEEGEDDRAEVFCEIAERWTDVNPRIH